MCVDEKGGNDLPSSLFFNFVFVFSSLATCWNYNKEGEKEKKKKRKGKEGGDSKNVELTTPLL